MSLLILEINVSIFCWQHITDNDIEALVSDEIFQPEVVWSLGDLQVVLRRVPVAFELWHNYFSSSPLRIFSIHFTCRSHAEPLVYLLQLLSCFVLMGPNILHVQWGQGLLMQPTKL